MVDPGTELSSIDFASMIGGPLTAVVNAQAQAALSSVNFIKAVGFKKSDKPGATETDIEPVYVDFTYTKMITPYIPPPADHPEQKGTDPRYGTFDLRVPILTMLPIPFIRIEETTIDFNAKINSMEYSKTTSELGISSSLEAKAGWLTASAKLNVSVSYKRNTESGSNVERTYSMVIHVRAVQDEMPAGLERLLTMLEGSMQDKPHSS